MARKYNCAKQSPKVSGDYIFFLHLRFKLQCGTKHLYVWHDPLLQGKCLGFLKLQCVIKHLYVWHDPLLQGKCLGFLKLQCVTKHLYVWHDPLLQGKCLGVNYSG